MQFGIWYPSFGCFFVDTLNHLFDYCIHSKILHYIITVMLGYHDGDAGVLLFQVRHTDLQVQLARRAHHVLPILRPHLPNQERVNENYAKKNTFLGGWGRAVNLGRFFLGFADSFHNDMELWRTVHLTAAAFLDLPVAALFRSNWVIPNTN